MKNLPLPHRRHLLYLIIATGIIIIYVAAAYYKTGICFETNDDRFLSEILSGILSPEPDAHAVFLNYWLALPLSLLYRLAPSIPWYGGTLIFFHILAYTAIMDASYSRCETFIQYFSVTICVISFMLTAFSSLTQIQFTSTAGLLAISGYVCFLLNRSNKKKFFLFFLLEFLGFCVREDAMLMIQPFGLSLCLGLLEDHHGLGKKSWKTCLQIFLRIPAILLLIFFIAIIGNNFIYQSPEWKEYTQFNKMRAALYDIYETPNFEEISDILNHYQVSRAQYEAFRNGTILDWQIPIECGEEIISYAKEHYSHPNLITCLRTLNNEFFKSNHWKLNQITMIVWGVLLIIVIFHKHFIVLLPIIGVCIARFIVWGYLIWNGRYPTRVTHPLFLCEIALALSLLWLESQKKRPLWDRCILLFCCLIICIISYQSGKLQYYYATADNQKKLVFIEGMYEIQDYCKKHPENRYLMESVSASYYTGSALDSRLTQPRNYIVSGCWYSNSPSMRAKLKSYLSESSEFYFIIFQDGFQDNHPALQFLEEVCKCKAQITDHLTVSHGGTYVIYHLNVANKINVQRPETHLP